MGFNSAFKVLKQRKLIVGSGILKISYTRHVTLVLPGQCSRCHNQATDWKTVIVLRFPTMANDFPFKMSRMSLCLAQASVQWTLQQSDRDLKLARSPPSSTEVQNGWMFTFTLSFAFMAFTRTRLALSYKKCQPQTVTNSPVFSCNIIQSCTSLPKCSKVQQCGVTKNCRTLSVMFRNIKATLSVLCRISLKCLIHVITI